MKPFLFIGKIPDLVKYLEEENRKEQLRQLAKKYRANHPIVSESTGQVYYGEKLKNHLLKQ